MQFLAKTIQFALGDWLNYGSAKYGEKYAQAIEETPYTYGTLRNYAYVAGKIELSRRNDRLSFAHHSEVAKLDAAQQDAWLDLAVDENLTTRQLRQSINNTPAAAGRICPQCGYNYGYKE
ncbi:hypothetical protein LCGC14_2329150 [marine sediment metagenome]|uniref:Uncharacterized protein n=1 Tax=marine sediment metagenome TaxID=412755 RepID=A0A0F9FAE2_9ZZZZ